MATSKRDYSQLFVILNKNDLTKEQAVRTFTEGRTDSLRALTDAELKEMIRRLQPLNGIPPGDKQRKKMISLALSIKWASTSDQAVLELDEWCLKQKFKKKLNALLPYELGVLLTVLETKVYKDFLEHNV